MSDQSHSSSKETRVIGSFVAKMRDVIDIMDYDPMDYQREQFRILRAEIEALRNEIKQIKSVIPTD